MNPSRLTAWSERSALQPFSAHIPSWLRIVLHASRWAAPWIPIAWYSVHSTGPLRPVKSSATKAAAVNSSFQGAPEIAAPHPFKPEMDLGLGSQPTLQAGGEDHFKALAIAPGGTLESWKLGSPLGVVTTRTALILEKPRDRTERRCTPDVTPGAEADLEQAERLATVVEGILG
jgi:hypothetical protein